MNLSVQPQKYIQELIGKNLAMRRAMEGMSQRRLSELADISRQHLGEIEMGKQNVTIGTLRSCAKVLNCGLQDLLKGVE